MLSRWRQFCLMECICFLLCCKVFILLLYCFERRIHLIHFLCKQFSTDNFTLHSRSLSPLFLLWWLKVSERSPNLSIFYRCEKPKSRGLKCLTSAHTANLYIHCFPTKTFWWINAWIQFLCASFRCFVFSSFFIF